MRHKALGVHPGIRARRPVDADLAAFKIFKNLLNDLLNAQRVVLILPAGKEVPS